MVVSDGLACFKVVTEAQCEHFSIVTGGGPESVKKAQFIWVNTMKVIIQKIGYDYDINIVELEIPNDHIHMVIRGIPKQSPSDVIQIVKSITAREFFRIYPEIKKKYFWGGKFWTQSFLSKR